MYSLKNLLRIILDLALLLAAFILATYIRLEGSINTPTEKFIWTEQLPQILVLVIVLKLASLLIWGTYKRFWRYTDSHEIVYLARALFIPSLLMVLPRFTGISPQAGDLYALSYGVVLIDFLLSLTLLGGVRLLRYYMVRSGNIHERRASTDPSLGRKRTLVLGAGEAAIQAAKAIREHPEQGLDIVAALDDNPKKLGMQILRGVTVKGHLDDLARVVRESNIQQIIIAIPSANQELKRKLSLAANETGIDVRVLPGVDQLAGGKVTVDQIRKLSMEDLLGRAEVDLNEADVIQYLSGKRVLVTGAGGSIGSELCRQLVSKCEIASLCLLGKGENSIFEAASSLRGKVQLETKIADIRNYSRVLHIVREFKPDIIFHAAAHKHVHLMELNSCEAFDNNVIGSRNIAQIAGECGVKSMVLISTDKAVNPTSIMGSTKNLAEKTVLMVSRKYPATKYTAVRFGNVLGSRGSVIKVWEDQLRQGLPLTVTHAEAIRYFMTIPEAAQLVIQGAAKANNGEIMVLDMGTPIKIYELAQQFIKLAGFSLEEIPIKVIGLREGEKLYEELLTDSEFVESKLTDKIYKARIDTSISEAELAASIERFTALSAVDNDTELKIELRKLIASNAVKV